MDVVSFLHGYGARVLVVFAVVLALWGSYHYFRDRRLSGGFRSTYLIMAAVTALQGLLGLAALLLGAHPTQGLLHMVYGIFAVLFLPGASAYTRGNDSRREAVSRSAASRVWHLSAFL